MPSLLELQRGMRDSVTAQCEQDSPAWIRGNKENAIEPLAVYRNTILATCTRALRLAFPTVERLVGREFFEAAAQIFALEHPPAGADMNAYGARFPEFLQGFAPCAALVYLPDVSRLDWAVARALHAPDVRPLAVDLLTRVRDEEAASLSFGAHPSVALLAAEYPVDAIWRAVLQQDDDAMRAVDLMSGPAHLLVQRVHDEVSVIRLSPGEWDFASALMAGHSLETLLESFSDADVPALLADHLTAGRLVVRTTDVAEGAIS